MAGYGYQSNRTAASPTKCSSDAPGWLPSPAAATSVNLRAQSASRRTGGRSFRESSHSLDGRASGSARRRMDFCPVILYLYKTCQQLDSRKASKILGSVAGGARCRWSRRRSGRRRRSSSCAWDSHDGTDLQEAFLGFHPCERRIRSSISRGKRPPPTLFRSFLCLSEQVFEHHVD
ncbi:hypothetical protein SORBI_3004G092100 [Sorghum bicolor]|jgi:hypothetical protein|uniref:Uncharacterized protein n=1 Tax=Sorghum bicolor TaxID=4558 RepID=A0A1Z5RMM7_SORBI|nr:hypothetical protein SORBI_3004G092100 [Sorghum bicolor]